MCRQKAEAHTCVWICGSHHDDGGADACSLTEPQPVVLLLGEDGRLVVRILHVHDHLQGAQAGTEARPEAQSLGTKRGARAAGGYSVRAPYRPLLVT